MRDPYDILGLSRTASAAEIKRAYRKLAKANHPDHHPDDKKAQERFAEANAAYEILGDKEKREKFDCGEIDAEGKPRFQGFEGFAGGPGGAGGAGGFDPRDFSDIFQSFSRGGAGGPGGGRSRTFRFATGPGGRATHTGGAAGDEDILNSIFGAFGGGGGRAREAPRARPQKGADVKAEIAVTLENLVSGAKPTVSLPGGRDVALTLPKGVRDGQVIRLKGQGHASPSGGQPGDALVTVRFVPHPRFRVDGSALRVEVPVPLDVAVLGGKAPVPTLEGSVNLTVPPHTSGGRVLRLKGKGLPTEKGRGDLLVTLRIELPDSADPELEALMRKWRETGASAKKASA